MIGETSRANRVGFDNMDVLHGAGADNKRRHRHCPSPSFLSSPPAAAADRQQLVKKAARTRWWWPPLSRVSCATTRRTLPAVCVSAALLAVSVVVFFGAAGEPNGMPASLFLDDEQGLEHITASNLTADHLLDGLLTPEFSYGSCRSRYDFASYYKKSSRKPSPYLIAKLRKQEALQKRCGPGTAAHEEARRRLEAGEGADDADNDNEDECRYLVYISYRGLGNRMLGIASAFLYAVVTDRVLLVDGGKDVGDLFCEPFPGTTWLLPRPSWWQFWSPLRGLKNYDEDSKASLGNMLQSGAASGDGSQLSWSSAPRTPPFVYLHLAGGYGYHDKLFFCGAHQRLLRAVPWLLMKTDNYLVPGLFLTPPFRAELEAMFPEKDAAFHHLGRYLFHPSNAVWHAVTTYHRANLAGAGRRVVGIQIRVFQKDQPRQVVLDQALSCVRNEKLLPEKLLPEKKTAAAANATSSPSYAVLVTSLSSWYYERIRDEYGGGTVAGGVHQPSHEGRQRWYDAAHDMRALSEMYLLSTCDVLVTTGFSTFGYVAQGLAGLRPWVMPRAPMWAKDWREGLDPRDPPCLRMASVEPCFHTPSAYDCAAGRDIDLDRVTPYIRRCVDVRWGIKLVNESSSQW